MSAMDFDFWNADKKERDGDKRFWFGMVRSP